MVVCNSLASDWRAHSSQTAFQITEHSTVCLQFNLSHAVIACSVANVRIDIWSNLFGTQKPVRNGPQSVPNKQPPHVANQMACLLWKSYQFSHSSALTMGICTKYTTVLAWFWFTFACASHSRMFRNYSRFIQFSWDFLSVMR